MAFIDGKKYKALSEAMKNGDDRAKAILLAQYNGEDDKIDGLLNEYFNPVQSEPEIEPAPVEPEPEPEPEKKPQTYKEKLEKFLKDNGITDDDEEYNEYVEEFDKEHHEEKDEEHECECECETLDDSIKFLLDDEIEAIQGYEKIILKISTMSMGDSERKGLMAELNEIKNDEFEHVEKLRRLLDKHSGIDKEQ